MDQNFTKLAFNIETINDSIYDDKDKCNYNFDQIT